MSVTDATIPGPEEDPKDDLRSEIVAAMEPTPDPEPEPGSSTSPAEAGPVDAASPAPATADGRARGPDGKFIAAEAAPEKAAPATTEIPSTDTTKASEPPASTPALAPPAGWTAAEKAAWTTLPPAVQAAVSRREQEIQNGGRQWSEQKRQYETVLAPVVQAAQRRGIPVDVGINNLVRANEWLERDPVSAIQWLARAHNVDLATLVGQPSAEGSREASPQQVDMRSYHQTYVAPLHERMMIEQQQRNAQAAHRVDEFANSVGKETFDKVEKEIITLIPLIKETNPFWDNDKVLAEAYARAVYANPETRAAVQAAERQSEEAKRQQEAKARVAKARTAASSVTGSMQGTQSTEPLDSIREELIRAGA